MNESLYKENIAKEREIRKLNKDVQQYEQTILSLRNEISIAKYHTPDVSKKDAEVMTGMSCLSAAFGDWEPVKDFSAALRDDMISYQERIQKMDNKLKLSNNDVRALRSANVTLREELHGLRGVCAALAQQCQSQAMRDQFKDDIIREMRRQLKQAKAQSKEVAELLSRSGSQRSHDSRDKSSRRLCVRDQPRRSRDLDLPDASGDGPLSLSDDCRSPRLVLSRDELLPISPEVATSTKKTSTPNVSRLAGLTDTGQSPDTSAIMLEKSTSAPVLLTEDSIMKIEKSLLKKYRHDLPDANSTFTIEDNFLEACSCHSPRSGATTSKVLKKKFLECSSYTPGSTTRDTGKSVRIQVPEERKVDELFFLGKPGSSCNGRGVSPAPAYFHESPTTPPKIETLLKVKSDSKCDAVKAETPESIGRSSEVDSPSSSCASARAQYYHDKLLATLQILHNKEETIRVQAESLSVAEARIASLTTRGTELKKEIDRKERELKTLRETIQARRKENTNVSITAEIQDFDNQKNIVTTLQTNLGVIEELYRECFYETAKQDGLIEMLRKSYLDVRLMEKEKSDQISRLHNVINTQKWSLEKCQDIASDVENLKVEISNFLNNSNNDSGVWEESQAGSLTDDLQDITEQLLRLRELLTSECTCGLEEENRILRQNNEGLEMQIGDLRQKITDYNNILENKDSVDKQHQEQIRARESELHSIRKQLAAVEYNTREKGQTCETIKLQLEQTKQLLDDKTAELSRVQMQCQQHELTINQLTEELEHYKDISKEYSSLRGGRSAVQQRVRSLREELAQALHHAAEVDEGHRAEVKYLKEGLCEALARGAALCEETRRAVCSVRAWTRRRRDINREQEDLIKQQKSRIRLLELRLEQGQNDTTLTRASENDTCTKCISATYMNSFEKNNRSGSLNGYFSEGPSCSKCPGIEGSFTSTSSKVQGRRGYAFETSASEMGISTPMPPQRPSRKRFFCENRISVGTREASVQRPERRDATSHTCAQADSASGAARCHVEHVRVDNTPRDVFRGSVDEVLSRVESAGAALADSVRRWNRRSHTH